MIASKNSSPKTSEPPFPTPNNTTAGHEAELWQAANKMRGNVDASEYKHVVLGLIFLKYISDAFEGHRAHLETERGQGADPEDSDEYKAKNILWVPLGARWREIQAQAKQPDIGQVIDEAMGTSRKRTRRCGMCWSMVQCSQSREARERFARIS